MATAAGAAILGIVQPRQITQQTGSRGGPQGHGQAVHASWVLAEAG